MTRQISAVVGIGLALSAMSICQAQSTDQVYGYSGSPTRGTVTAMTRTEVTVDVNGNERKLPVNKVRRISFLGEPSELRSARQYIGDGRFEDAVNALGRINLSDVQRKEILQDIAYYKLYAQGRLVLSGGGDKNAVASELLDFAKKNSQTYHFYEAAELLGDLSLAMGAHANAETYYSNIANTAPWPEYKMRAGVLLGKAQLEQDSFADAQKAFSAVLAGSLDTQEAQELKLMAEVGLAICLAETQQTDEAVEQLEKIIAEHDPQQHAKLFAHTYNALGRSYIKAGKEKDALLAYLHVDLLFYADAEAHAEALYNLSNLWGKVNEPDRAVRARSLLQSRYAGSRWAKK